MSSHVVILGSRDWLRAYVTTMRPYLFFVSGAAGLVGEALVDGTDQVRCYAVFLPLFLAYGFGQALTDTFQLDTDSVSAPYRPLVRGEIGVGAVRWTSLVGLSASSLLLCALSAWVLIPAGLAVLGLLAYTPCKRRYWAGPACNALVVALLPYVGAVALLGVPWVAVNEWRLHALALSVFGSYAVFVVIGYLKDIEADRGAGYDTLPVHFGVRPTVLVSAGFATLGIAGSSAVVCHQVLGASLGLAQLPGLFFWSFGLVCTALCHARAWKITRDDAAHGAITWSVRGFLALHLGEALLLKPSLAILAVVLAAAFECVLARRPARSQI